MERLNMGLEPKEIVSNYSSHLEMIRETDEEKAKLYIQHEIEKIDKLIEDPSALGEGHALSNFSKGVLNSIREELENLKEGSK